MLRSSLESRFTSAGVAHMTSDGVEGVRMVYAEFAAGVKPVVELTSRVQTRDRADLDGTRAFVKEDAATLRHYTRATHLLPTDGIVRQTASPRTAMVKVVNAQDAQVQMLLDSVMNWQPRHSAFSSLFGANDATPSSAMSWAARSST